MQPGQDERERERRERREIQWGQESWAGGAGGARPAVISEGGLLQTVKLESSGVETTPSPLTHI